jgi:hypothetical protein
MLASAGLYSSECGLFQSLQFRSEAGSASFSASASAALRLSAESSLCAPRTGSRRRLALPMTPAQALAHPARVSRPRAACECSTPRRGDCPGSPTPSIAVRRSARPGSPNTARAPCPTSLYSLSTFLPCFFIGISLLNPLPQNTHRRWPRIRLLLADRSGLRALQSASSSLATAKKYVIWGMCGVHSRV